MERIQLIVIFVSALFLLYISYLIVRGKLREEYAIVWIIATAVLFIFSFWREGLERIAAIFGVYEAPNLVFTGAIGTVMIYLLHLSVVSSRLHRQNKRLAQELALMKSRIEELEMQNSAEENNL